MQATALFYAWLLYLNDQGRCEGLVSVDYDCASALILSIAKADCAACRCLLPDLVSQACEVLHATGCHTDPVFMILAFFWYADLHD